MHILADLILISGMVITLLVLFLLAKAKKKGQSNQILSLLFWVLFIFLLHCFSDLHSIMPLYLGTYVFEDTIELLIGPLLWLYVKSIYQQENSFWIKNWIHFLPAILYACFVSFPFVYSRIQGIAIPDLSEKIAILRPYFVFFIGAYSVFSIIKLRAFRKQLKLNFSSLNERDLQWANMLLYWIFALCCIDLLIIVYEFFNGYAGWEYNLFLIFPLVFMIAYLGYHGVSQSEVLLPDFISVKNEEKVETKPASDNEKTVIHHLSNTSEEEINALKSKLLEVMENERPYLNEDLTLGLLATAIESTDKKLSALLNHYLETTFYDFVNGYRVEAVKAKMQNDNFAHYTLLAIAFDCGFKSKTSFNRIFKNATGLSPSAFKKGL